MDLAILQRRFTAKAIGNDVFVNGAGAFAQHFAAAFALRNAVRLAAAGHGQLADSQREFLA